MTSGVELGELLVRLVPAAPRGFFRGGCSAWRTWESDDETASDVRGGLRMVAGLPGVLVGASGCGKYRWFGQYRERWIGGRSRRPGGRVALSWNNAGWRER